MALRSSQGSNGLGWSPISFEAIDAWARMTRAQPTAFEVELIRRIDAAVAELVAKRDG